MMNFRVFQSVISLYSKSLSAVNLYGRNGIQETFRLVHSTSLQSKTNEEQNVLVYEGPLKRRIKVVKYISLSSSAVGLSVFPFLMRDLSQVSIALSCGAGAISSMFMATPLLLNWITKRYVLQLYYNPQSKQFTAKTFNLLNEEKELQFSASDVSVPDIPGMLTSFLVKDIPLFVDATIVKDPDAYSHMMGYDKPFGFELHSETQKDTKEP